MRILAYICVVISCSFIFGGAIWHLRDALRMLFPDTLKGWLWSMLWLLMGIMLAWGMATLGHPLHL
jgi:hypothetical protein